MKFYSVLTKRQYEDERGQGQVQWFKAGFVKENQKGGRFLQMYHQPNTTYFLVPQDEPTDVINIDD